MALKIRLRRMGRKKAPTYRIVVAESSMPRDGRFVANLGHYNPRAQPAVLVVDRERARYWLEQGATPTDTAKSLLKRSGVFGAEPTVAEGVVETAKGAARQAVDKAKGVAAAAVEAVRDAAEEVREAVGGETQAEADRAE